MSSFFVTDLLPFIVPLVMLEFRAYGPKMGAGPNPWNSNFGTGTMIGGRSELR